jgi:hypothetical protein
LNLDKFGAKWVKGNKIDVYSKLRSWFLDKKGVDIVSYYTVFYPQTRKKIWIDKKDLHKCEICGTKLYTLNNKLIEEGEEESHKDMTITQKKHMICLDKSGNKHMTCFGISRCFRRVNFMPDSTLDADTPPPSLEDILEVDPCNVDEVFWKSIESDFNLNVRPFMIKWMAKEISKDNVLEFVSDMGKIDNHMAFYDSRAGDIFIKKLLLIVGIHK